MAETTQTEGNSDVSTQATPRKESKIIYEVGFHLVPTVAEAEVGAAVEKLRAAVKTAGGSIVAEEAPVRMKLAYRIERSDAGKREKYTESWFGWMKFEGMPEALRPGIPGLQDALRADRTVLRFLLVETVRESAAPARAVFSSDRLEGETIVAPKRAPEKGGEVSEAELEKGIDALIS